MGITLTKLGEQVVDNEIAKVYRVIGVSYTMDYNLLDTEYYYTNQKVYDEDWNEVQDEEFVTAFIEEVKRKEGE